MNERQLLFISLLLCFFASQSVLHADEEPSPALFQSASSAYESGRYSKAQELYERLISQNLESAELYFNLGNTHFRLGRLGKARLYYERAKRLAPGDDDVDYNLNLVAAQVEETTDGSGEFFKTNRSLINGILALLNLLFFTVLGLGLSREQEWIWWARWVLGSLVAAALVLAVISRQASLERQGVILEPRVEVRVGPGDNYKVGFTVPEGRKVLVFSSQNNWTQIGVPRESLKGWIPAAAVEEIHTR